MSTHLSSQARQSGRTLFLLVSVLVLLSGTLATNASAAPAGSKGATHPGQSGKDHGRQSGKDHGRREAQAQNADRGRSGAAPGRSGDAPSAGASADGSGGNGTRNDGITTSGAIKIASLGSDPHPENEPHPGCGFSVDFYGFPEGWLTTEIALHPPSGRQFLDSGRSLIAQDARGSEYQTSIIFDLTERLRSMDPGADRFHIRVDTRRDDARANDFKTKVFWVECPASDAAAGVAADGTILSSDTGAVAGPDIPLVLAGGLTAPVPPYAVSPASGTEPRVAASADVDRTVSAGGSGGLALTGAGGSLILPWLILMAIGASLRRSKTT